MATTKNPRAAARKRDERAEDPRFGKARNDDPPDPYHDSTSIAPEPPRLDVARRAELEEAQDHSERNRDDAEADQTSR